MLVSLGQLWLPILLAAIACHFVGFLVWVVLPHHRNDYSPLPDEAGVRALLKGKLTPGQYLMPWWKPGDEKSPDVITRRTEGPNAFLTVLPNGTGHMPSQMVKNVLFHLLVSTFVAYICAATLAPGTPYLKVFQVAGASAFLAYGMTWGHAMIWFGRPPAVAFKDAVDGLLMALVTAGFLGWRWPGM